MFFSPPPLVSFPFVRFLLPSFHPVLRIYTWGNVPLPTLARSLYSPLFIAEPLSSLFPSVCLSACLPACCPRRNPRLSTVCRFPPYVFLPRVPCFLSASPSSSLPRAPCVFPDNATEGIARGACARVCVCVLNLPCDAIFIGPQQTRGRAADARVVARLLKFPHETSRRFAGYAALKKKNKTEKQRERNRLLVNQAWWRRGSEGESEERA